jgi:hypothetical protein
MNFLKQSIAMKKNAIYSFLLGVILFPASSGAQCSASLSVSSTGCGVPALLEAGMNKPILYLEWTQTGIGVVRRDTATYNKAGTTLPLSLNHPGGMFLHPNGDIYVAEQDGHKVVKWTPGGGAAVTVAGGNGAGAGLNQLNAPLAVVVGAGDTVFVLEYSNNRVTKWAPGASQGIVAAGNNGAGPGLNQLSGAHGMAIDQAGNLYVADRNNNRIIRFPPGSNQSTSGVALPVAISQPVSVALDKDGNIYAGEEGGKVWKFAAGTYSSTLIATGTQRARGMSVDNEGNLWVAEDRNFQIVRYAPGSGVAQLIVGTGSNGTGPTQLFWPTMAAVDPDSGYLYVTDYGNNRLQRYTPVIADTLTVNTTGQYSIEAKNFAGCSATASATVSSGGGPAITPGANPSVCVGAPNASLPYSNPVNTPDQYSITWSGAAQTAGFTNVTNQTLSGSPIVIPVPAGAAVGTYDGSLTVRNSSSGCVSNGYNISVTLVTGASITPGTNPSVCPGATVASLPYSGASGSPNQYSIAWDGAAQSAGFTDVTNQTLASSPLSITIPGTVAPATYNASLTVRNSATGCVSVPAAIAVTVHPKPSATIASPTGSVALCQGRDTMLTAGSGIGYSYEWKNAQGVVGSGINYTAATTGNYYVVVTDANNCKDSSTALSVTVHPRPQISITPGDTAFCAGGFVRLEGVSPDTGLGYRWKEGNDDMPLATASFVEITETGVYSVVATRTAVPGCSDSSAPVTVTVHPLPDAPVNWDGSTLHTDPGHASYQWLISGQPVPGATNSSFTPGVQGTYSVRVTDANGCTSTSAPLQVQLGIGTISGEQIHIYPNPVQSFLYLRSAAPVVVSIYSMEGRMIIRQEGATLTMDMTSFPDGVYVIRVTDKEGSLVLQDKLIKQTGQ